MKRVEKAAYEANNGVVVVDPNTGELRPAGTYSQNEWTQLAKANPNLTEALIQNRAQRKEVAEAQEAKRAGVTLAGGILAGTALFETVGQAVVQNNLIKALDWHEQSQVPQGTEIYHSDKSTVFAPQRGVVEFATVPGMTQEEKLSEAIRARGAFREYKNSPEGQKLFRTVPADLDPVKQDQKERIYKHMGFESYPREMRLDNRRGADQFKDLYRVGDSVMDFAGTHSIATARGLRYGGAALAGLMLGGIAHGAWNMINPINEV